MPTLVVIEGPTGVGKTEVTLSLAERLCCPIVNADSRQIFREIPIGTAAPTEAEQKRVKHYFVGTESVLTAQNYSAGTYERQAIEVLRELFKTHSTLVLSGGSMMYVNAVCYGLDDLPEISLGTRQRVQYVLREKGLTYLQKWLKELDPEYYEQVDLNNPQRVCHAIEICLEAGRPFSSLRSGRHKPRDFQTLRIALTRPRAELYERINKRVDMMVDNGLLEEAERVLAPYHSLNDLPNSLNTVGYKELMQVQLGQWDIQRAIDMIKQNSRRYAKRQMTWLRREKNIHWININEYETQQDIVAAILSLLDSMH